MKILLVNDFAELAGGTEYYLFSVKEELESRGHAVRLFTGDLNFKNFGYKKSYIKMFELLFNFKYLVKFYLLFKEFKPDIVHVNNIFYELSPSFLIFLHSTPTVMTVHDNQLFSPVAIQTERKGKYCSSLVCRGCSNCVGMAGMLYEKVKRIIYANLLSNINFYIGNSDYINNIIGDLNLGKVYKIPYCIDTFNFSPIKFTGNILFVGRLTKEKGVMYLIDALPKILINFPATHLTIIGDGPELLNIKNLIKRLSLSKNVTILSKVDHKQLYQYYENHDLFIFPSVWPEPFGKVGVESMSVGRPVIGSNIGGIPEWLIDGETGILVKPGSSEEIASAVIRVIRSRSLLVAMSKKAKLKSNEYKLSTHVDNLISLYESLN